MSKKIKMPEMSADMPKAKRIKITTLVKQIRVLENIHPNFRTKEQKKEIKKLQSEIQDYFDRRNSQIKTLVKEKAFVKKKGRPRKDMPEIEPKHAFVPVDVFFNPPLDIDTPKKKIGRPRKNTEPQHAFIPVDAFNPLDPDYDELYVDNMPKKKIGRPRKNPILPPTPPAPPAPKKKIGRPRKNTEPAPTLESFTKRTVIVGDSNQKESLALEFSNQRVEALKADNKKLLEINNEKIIEVSKLKSEINQLNCKLQELNKEEIEEENYYKEEIDHLKNNINKLESKIIEANTEAFNAKNQLASLEAFLHKEQNKNNKFSLKRFFATLFVFLLGWVIGIAIMFAMANF